MNVTKWGHFTNAIVNLLKSTLLMIFQMKSIKKEKIIKIIAKEKKTNHNKFGAFQINKKTLEIIF